MSTLGRGWTTHRTMDEIGEMKSRWKIDEPLYIDKCDKRWAEQKTQLDTYGFSDSETWSLCSVFAEFVLPRLKRFKEISISHPIDLTQEEWSEILCKIIFSFEWVLKVDNFEEESIYLSPEESNKVWKEHMEGLRLFSKYFMDLWW